MKIFLIILGSYLLLKLIMLTFPWGRWVVYQTCFPRIAVETYQIPEFRTFIPIICRFFKSLFHKKEGRSKYLRSIMKTILEDFAFISLVIIVLTLLYPFLIFIYIGYALSSKANRDAYTEEEKAKRKELQQQWKDYKKNRLKKRKLAEWEKKSPFEESDFLDETKLPYIILSRDLPFTPRIDEVIYVEASPQTNLHTYLIKSHDELINLYKLHGYNFIFPAYAFDSPVPEETIRYLFPFYDPEKTPIRQRMISCEELNKYIVGGKITRAGFIHFLPIKVIGTRFYNDEQNIPQPIEENYYFSYFHLDSLLESFRNDVTLHLKIIRNNLQGSGRRHDMYSLEIDKSNDCTADKNFSFEARKLAKEIEERIKQLKALGIRETQLMELFEQNITLSHLHITSDFKIFLTDYNNIEIKLTPLQKSVFFLFLNHPEGIVFKELGNYKEELFNIYKKLTSRVIDEKTEESINALVDPSNNSINEKCARIREAFVKEFDLRYAKHYVVDGERGEPKKISLPRELVVWDSPLKL